MIRDYFKVIGSGFFAFWIILIGTTLAPQIVGNSNIFFKLLYILSISISNIWVICIGLNIFKENNGKTNKRMDIKKND
jgi:hypothetical protein